jgi:hypothetical protein
LATKGIGRATMNIVGKLRIGMTREVVAVLGKPDDVSVLSRGQRLPAIYKYGEIELYFGPDNTGGLYMAYTEVETEEGDWQGIVLLK